MATVPGPRRATPLRWGFLLRPDCHQCCSRDVRKPVNCGKNRSSRRVPMMSKSWRPKLSGAAPASGAGAPSVSAACARWVNNPVLMTTSAASANVGSQSDCDGSISQCHVWCGGRHIVRAAQPSRLPRLPLLPQQRLERHSRFHGPQGRHSRRCSTRLLSLAWIAPIRSTHIAQFLAPNPLKGCDARAPLALVGRRAQCGLNLFAR
jgi:hypothetical protein